MNTLLEMIGKGIEDGSMARFLFALMAAVVIVYLAVSGNAVKPEMQPLIAICTFIIGQYFGGQTKPPQVGGEGVKV